MEDRQIEPMFVLLSLLALVACASRLVPGVVQAPPADLAASPVLAEAVLDRPGTVDLPEGCLVRDEESRVYQNVADGYCLRYPAEFKLGEVLPGIANFYGPPRVPGSEPLIAGLVIRVQEIDGEQRLAEAAERFVKDQQRVGWLGPAHTLVETTLDGRPAVLLQGPGEYTRLQIVLAVHRGKRYTLSFWPDPEQYPQIAADMDSLRQTVLASFSFLPAEAPLPQGPVRQQASARRP